MTAQMRERIGPLQDSCKGLTLWVVGAGTSLDDVPLEVLRDRYVFALNSAITYFTEVDKFPDAWWIWFDTRCYREIWPQIKEWKRVQAILHKQAMEQMRSLLGSGRYVEYDKETFRGKRSVVETALKLGDFLGFKDAMLVGVDGLVANDKGRPYALRINNWKKCYFQDPGNPRGARRSIRDFHAAMDNLMPLPRMKVYQTSPLYKGEQFERLTFDEAVLRGTPKNGHKKKKAQLARAGKHL